MKSSYVGLASAFTIYFVLLGVLLSSPAEHVEPFTQTYVNGPTNVTGFIQPMLFPGRQFVSVEAAHGKPLFAEDYYMAVVCNLTENAKPFFLFDPEQNGTIWETMMVWPRSGSHLGGLTGWDIYGVYTSMCTVTVKGDAFTVNRGNWTYQCIVPRVIEVHNRVHLPLFIVQWRIYDNGFHETGLYGSGTNFAENQIFVDRSDYGNSTEFYRVTLVKGESLRFSAEQPKPFNLRVYSSVGRSPPEYLSVLGSTLYEFENVTTVNQEFTAAESGAYSFAFYTDYEVDGQFTVIFKAGRVEESSTP